MATVTCLLAFFKRLEALGRVQALFTVLLRLATTTAKTYTVLPRVSSGRGTRREHAHATYGAFYKERPSKMSAQEDEWTAIVVLCVEYGRWPTVIMHTVLAYYVCYLHCFFTECKPTTITFT